MDFFPVLGGKGDGLPWTVLAPHEQRAQANHGGQSLERLAQRGGLSYAELWFVLNDQPYVDAFMAEADKSGRRLVVMINSGYRAALKAAADVAGRKPKQGLEHFDTGTARLIALEIRALPVPPAPEQP